MDDNLNKQASHRIAGTAVPVGRVSSPATPLGQSERFSDGFLTKSPVVTLHSG